MPKRKEHFYLKIQNNERQAKNKSKYIQELNESIATEADSGFETFCSSTADSTTTDADEKFIHDRPITLRRSPRNASALGRITDSCVDPEGKDLLFHSTSLDALSKSPQPHVLTRSKSLNLSNESFLSKVITSPIGKKLHSKHRDPVWESDLEKASTCVTSKFDSSLLDSSKRSVNEEYACKHYDTESNDSEKEILVRSSSVLSDKENGKDKKSRASTFKHASYQVHRDIHTFSHFGKPQHYHESRLRNHKDQNINNRIVYCPGLFHGRERMDILRRLNDMNATHILSSILSGVSAEDLGRALQVSKHNWSRVCLFDSKICA